MINMSDIRIITTPYLTRYDFKDCVIIVQADKKEVKAWTEKGSASWFIKPAEKDMFRFDPEKAIRQMQRKVNAGLGRCSRCGWEGKREEFKFGYMAAILCVACIAEDIKETENDIKTGNICLKCHQPRSRCTC